MFIRKFWRWLRSRPEKAPLANTEHGMFNRIDILLKGPICPCEEKNLSWGIRKDGENRSCLLITCEICKTELLVSAQRLVARIIPKTPYPGKKEPEPVKKKKKRRISAKKDGNLITFPGTKKKDTQ